jgi:hypothetical protein
MLDKADLEKLEEKYFSPPHFLIFRTDDSSPIHVVKGGASDVLKLFNMHSDINMLLRELRELLELEG